MGFIWQGLYTCLLIFFPVIFNGASVYLKTFEVKLLSKIFA
jgi:hypothetical protein